MLFTIFLHSGSSASIAPHNRAHGLGEIECEEGGRAEDRREKEELSAGRKTPFTSMCTKYCSFEQEGLACMEIGGPRPPRDLQRHKGAMRAREMAAYGLACINDVGR